MALIMETSHRRLLNVAKLVRALVENYPAHGFVISRNEATRLGLPIRPAEAHPRWSLIKQLHQKSADEHDVLCFMADDKELDELASKLQAQNEATNEEGDNDEPKADAAEPNPTATVPIVAERDRPDGSRPEHGGVLKSRP